MGQITEAVLKHLDARGIRYELDEDGDSHFFVQMDHSILRMSVEVMQDQNTLRVTACAPLFVPEEKRTAMAELLARANYGLIRGNFELNCENGRIRFKSSLDTNGVELPDEMIDPLLRTSWNMMDHCLPAITQVAFGGVPAKEAFDQLQDRQAPPVKSMQALRPAGEAPAHPGLSRKGVAGKRSQGRRLPSLIYSGPKGVA